MYHNTSARNKYWQRPSMITFKGKETEYAQAMASALMAELSPGDHHISPSNKSKLAEKIYDRVPSRQELNFFIEQGEPAAKRHMGAELSSQDKQELFDLINSSEEE